MRQRIIVSPFHQARRARRIVVVPGQQSFAHLTCFNEVTSAMEESERGTAQDAWCIIAARSNGKAA